MISYEKIKELCERKGVTVTQCERECGFSKGSLCKIEKSKPNAKRLQLLSEYFNVSVDFLLTGDEKDEQYYADVETQRLAQKIYENPSLHMLFDATRDATPSELKSFYDMVMIMKKRERHEDD